MNNTEEYTAEKNILVTGGAGYIGSHTCKMLYDNGFNPIVLDNLIYGHEKFVKWGPLVKGDILNHRLLEDVFQTYQPSAVMHFAAFAYVGESVKDPGKYYSNNVAGTIALLEAMRRNDCRHFAFPSTCATYGVPKSVPITEDMVQLPINPYGSSKLMIEKILADYDRAYGIRHCSLRYFNAAGADSGGQLGEDHTPETHLIPLVINAAMHGKSFIEVYGTDYQTPDGTAVRDYIHVTDLADAHIKALAYLLREGCSDQFNLGTGIGVSVQEVIDTVTSVCGRVFNIKFGERRDGDPPELIADAGKARQFLGWEPQHSDIENIIQTAWAWHTRKEV